MNLEQLVVDNDPGLYITEAVSQVLRMIESSSEKSGNNTSRISRLLSTLTSFRRRHNPTDKFKTYLNEWKNLQPHVRSNRSDLIANIANFIMTDTGGSEDLMVKANKVALTVSHPELAKFAAVVVHVGLKKSDLVIDEISSEAAKKIIFSPVKVNKIMDCMARLNGSVRNATPLRPKLTPIPST